MSYLNLLCQGYSIDEVIDLDEARKRLGYLDPSDDPTLSKMHKTYSRRAVSMGLSDLSDDGLTAGRELGVEIPHDDINGLERLRASGLEPNPVLANSIGNTFGPVKFQSDRREMLLKHVIPNLIYHADSPHTSEEGRSAALKEIDRHVGREASRIDRYVARLHKKLIPGMRDIESKGHDSGPAIYPTNSDDEYIIAGHDAFDHGYTGALPSEYGEVVAGYFDRRKGYVHDDLIRRNLLPLGRQLIAHRENDDLNSASPEKRSSAEAAFNKAKSLGWNPEHLINRTQSYYKEHSEHLQKLRNALKSTFRTIHATKNGSTSPQRVVPLDHVLNWSRSL